MNILERELVGDVLFFLKMEYNERRKEEERH